MIIRVDVYREEVFSQAKSLSHRGLSQCLYNPTCSKLWQRTSNGLRLQLNTLDTSSNAIYWHGQVIQNYPRAYFHSWECTCTGCIVFRSFSAVTSIYLLRLRLTEWRHVTCPTFTTSSTPPKCPLIICLTKWSDQLIPSPRREEAQALLAVPFLIYPIPYQESHHITTSLPVRWTVTKVGEGRAIMLIS